MRLWLVMSGIFGFLTVAGGAFGAHALRASLTPEQLTIFATGTRYGQVHAVLLAAIAILAAQRPEPALTVAGVAVSLGIVLFTGSLWMLSITQISWFGPITPLGGLALLVGWSALIVTGVRWSD
ncbi:MAG: DUF423 domain-containing protein [Myxococcota bacterium]|nr:DUF423 domain-containing protein [Myxococcota bacterium]